MENNTKQECLPTEARKEIVLGQVQLLADWNIENIDDLPADELQEVRSNVDTILKLLIYHEQLERMNQCP